MGDWLIFEGPEATNKAEGAKYAINKVKSRFLELNFAQTGKRDQICFR
jgi:hypothetical protein